MIVSDAREIARRWVAGEFEGTPGFHGAFFHGSIGSLSDDADLDPTSDVDLIVVTDDPDSPRIRGKLRVDRVLLDVSYLPTGQVQSAEWILGQSHLATSFRFPGIIADPSGRLNVIAASVSREFPKRAWVERRCQQALEKIRHGVHLQENDSFPDQVISWIFPAGITTHVLLIAGLKNPTVRKRYVAVRKLLADYGLSAAYDEFFNMIGCTHMSQSTAAAHFAALTVVFDSASRADKTPFAFASDISPLGRHIAIDGTRELIESDSHREAVFWMVVTWSRCLKVLRHNAPDDSHHVADKGYLALLTDLGISSPDDLRHRLNQVERSLPWVWELAQQILAANPDVCD